jgi:hypothetical protein
LLFDVIFSTANMLLRHYRQMIKSYVALISKVSSLSDP